MVMTLLAAPSFAADKTLLIENAWMSATPPGARTAAIYLDIDNQGADGLMPSHWVGWALSSGGLYSFPLKFFGIKPDRKYSRFPSKTRGHGIRLCAILIGITVGVSFTPPFLDLKTSKEIQ